MKLLSMLLMVAFLAVTVTGGYAADEPVKIAVIAAKSGDAAATNEVFFQAVKFVVDELNSGGGLLGRRIEIIEYDNESSSLGSKDAAKKAVAENVLAVIGAIWSEHSMAVAHVMQEAKIPMITPQSTNADVTLVGDYIFRTCYSDAFQGAAMAGFAREDLKAEKAVVLVNIDRKYSEGLAEYFMRSFRDKGGNILWKGDFLIDVSDYSSLLEKAKSYQPDVIFLPSDYRDSSHVIGQARKMGITATFLGGDAYGVRMYDYIGALVDGNYYTTHWHRDEPAPRSQQLVKGYEAKYGVIKQTTIPLTYDSFMLLADAVRRAGSLDRQKIREALAETRGFEGITGMISFDANRNPVKSTVVLKFENGKVVFVKRVQP